MRQLDLQLTRNRISGSDSIIKALGMPNIDKSYDISVKTSQEKWRSEQFGQFEDTPLPPQSKTSSLPNVVGRGQGENNAIVMGEKIKSMGTARTNRLMAQGGQYCVTASANSV